MISLTYALRGVLLATTGWLFTTEVLSAVTQTRYWTAIFFIASSAASAAYLTVCEIFPLEVRDGDQCLLCNRHPDWRSLRRRTISRKDQQAARVEHTESPHPACLLYGRRKDSGSRSRKRASASTTRLWSSRCGSPETVTAPITPVPVTCSGKLPPCVA